ncbi:MAG: winged helix-turn-helix domain-containing protein [Archaeoglobaceae archaeon]
MREKEDKILDSGTRKEILSNLRGRNKTLSELSRDVGVSKPAVLKHLYLLSSSQVVERVKNGNRFIYYRITEKGRRVTDLMVSIFTAVLSSFAVHRFLAPEPMVFETAREGGTGDAEKAPMEPDIQEVTTPEPGLSEYLPWDVLQMEAIATFVLVFVAVFFILRMVRK